jgi:4-hydroxy-3-methylbut-2-enyl diphosphate reductase
MYFPGLEMVDTICGATTDRQEALRDLCDRVDAVIIAGGKDSANTRRLLSLAAELGKPAWIAESGKELPLEIAGFETVGLCAGASTPDDLIAEIEQGIEDRGRDQGVMSN